MTQQLRKVEYAGYDANELVKEVYGKHGRAVIEKLKPETIVERYGFLGLLKRKLYKVTVEVPVGAASRPVVGSAEELLADQLAAAEADDRFAPSDTAFTDVFNDALRSSASRPLAGQQAASSLAAATTGAKLPAQGDVGAPDALDPGIPPFMADELAASAPRAPLRPEVLPGRPSPPAALSPATIDGGDVLPIFAAAGFPAAVLAQAARDGVPLSLEGVLAHLPPVPGLPKVAGALVAVVGPAEWVLDDAARVARRMRVPVDRIAEVYPGDPSPPRVTSTQKRGVASTQKRGAASTQTDRSRPAGERGGQATKPVELVARGAASTAALAPGWRRSSPAVVAVFTDAAATASGARAVRKAVGQLRPTMVICAVEATAKPEDIAMAVAYIGGADALMVHRTKATCTPATVLNVGLPVLALERRPASIAAWRQLTLAAARRRGLSV